MISVTCKGIPMTKPADADGYVRFTLDDTKHDPIAVLTRMLKACGAEHTDHERDAQFNKVMTARKLGCERATCERQCAQINHCRLKA